MITTVWLITSLLRRIVSLALEHCTRALEVGAQAFPDALQPKSLLSRIGATTMAEQIRSDFVRNG